MAFPTLSTARKAWHCGALAALLALGACATLQPSAPLPAGTPPAAYRQSIDLKGRLSLRYERNGKEEAMHGNFEWSQTPAHVALTLSSPLGQTLAIVDISPGMATLKQANQAPRTAPDADTLIADALGWPLPVAGLRDWMQGVAIDATGKRIVAAPQADETVKTNDGWQLHFVSWEGEGAAARPKRIDLERYTAQAGQVSVRIVIDESQPH
jgi:outer membrane lipoprotein LolB